MNGYGLKVICFDYYGTLADVGQPFLRIREWFAEFLSKQGSLVEAATFNMTFTRQRARYSYHAPTFLNGSQVIGKSYINTCARYHLKPEYEKFMEFVHNIFTKTMLFEEVEDILPLLKKQFSVGLITNADNELLEQSLQRHRLTFDFIITSESVKCNKPEKAIFRYVIKQAELPPEKFLMIGDSVSEDILPAQALGMQGIWINRGGRSAEGGQNLQQIQHLGEMRELW